MYPLVVVGCGGAGTKFLQFVRKFIKSPSITINEHSSDILVDRSKAIMADSVHGKMIYEIYPWLQNISGENILVLGGLGGVVGTNISKLIGKALRKKSNVYGIFAEPFSAESEIRTKIARKAKNDIDKNYHAVIYLPNDKLIDYYPNLTMKEALEVHYVVIKHIVQDFERQIIRNMGKIEFRGTIGVGIGFGSGRERIRVSIEDALDSPWHVGTPRYAFFSGNLEREDIKVIIREYDFEYWDLYKTEEYGEEVKSVIFSR